MPTEKANEITTEKAIEIATEYEYLIWFRINADFGPSDSDVKDWMNRRFMEETGKNLPRGWNYNGNGEEMVDQ